MDSGTTTRDAGRPFTIAMNTTLLITSARNAKVIIGMTTGNAGRP